MKMASRTRNKDSGPIAKAMLKSQLLKELIDNLAEECDEVIKNKSLEDKGAKLQQLYKNGLNYALLFDDHQNNVERLKEKDEPIVVDNYDQQKTDEVYKLISMKNIVTDTLGKLLSAITEENHGKTEAAMEKGKDDEDKDNHESEEDEDESEEDDDDDESEDDDDGELEEKSTQPTNLKYVAITDFDAEESDDLEFVSGTILLISTVSDDGWWMAENEKGDKGRVPCTFLRQLSNEKVHKVDDNKDDEEEDKEVDGSKGIVKTTPVKIDKANKDEEKKENERKCDDKKDEEDDEEFEEQEDEEDDEEDDEEESKEEKPIKKRNCASKPTKVQKFKTTEAFNGESNEDLAFTKGIILTVLDKREDGWYMAENEKGEKGLVPCTFLQKYNPPKHKRRKYESQGYNLLDDEPQNIKKSSSCIVL